MLTLDLVILKLGYRHLVFDERAGNFWVDNVDPFVIRFGFFTAISVRIEAVNTTLLSNYYSLVLQS